MKTATVVSHHGSFYSNICSQTLVVVCYFDLIILHSSQSAQIPRLNGHEFKEICETVAWNGRRKQDENLDGR